MSTNTLGNVVSYPSHPPPPSVPTISKLDIYNDPSVFADLDQIAINVSIIDYIKIFFIIFIISTILFRLLEKIRKILPI